MPFGREDFCIWHVPKTGGVWLFNALVSADIGVWRLGQQHDMAEDYRAYHPYHAVLVRDPICWYSSVLRWMKAYGTREPLKRWFPGIEPAHLEDFDKFLMMYAGCYTDLMSRFIPRRAVWLRTSCIEVDTKNWLDTIGVEVPHRIFWRNRENISKYPPLQCSFEARTMVERTERALCDATRIDI